MPQYSPLPGVVSASDEFTRDSAPLDNGRGRSRAPDGGSVKLAQRLGGLAGSRVVFWIGLGTLLLLFLWVYGRFVGRLYFVLDDYIETEFSLARTWPQALIDSFTGAINWSGYRPLTYAIRATMAHAFGLETMWGYFAVSLGLLLTNVLLTYFLVREVSRSDLWAYVAAAVVLLLPAHNEAVLYMSANANLIALLFCLLSLEAARRAWLSRRAVGPWTIGVWIAYLCAILAYEVTLPLPLLLLAAQVVIRRQTDRSRPLNEGRLEWPLYVGLAVVAALALGLRFWATGVSLAPGRDDYAISLAPAALLNGYKLFAGQLVLLHSSAWLHTTPYADLREWISLTNPRALASMALAAAGTIVVFAAALRSRRESRACRKGEPQLWLAWGLSWVVLLALPFAALVGRNPENRYTTIPSFGYGVAVAAAAAWLAGPLLHNSGWARLRQALSVIAVTALITWYAFVSTSDVAEWERASAHTREFVTQAVALAPSTGGLGVAQVGVPSNVGGAYVFTTGESFRSAVHLVYSGAEPAVSSDLWLRNILADTSIQSGAPIPLIGFGYIRETHQLGLLDSAWACGVSCQGAAFTQPPNPSTTTRFLYAQFYSEAEPEKGGLGLLLAPGVDGTADALLSCWAFYDTDRVQIDPSDFSEDELTRRCTATGNALLASGAVRLLASAR